LNFRVNLMTSESVPRLRRGVLKTLIYIVILVASLFISSFIFLFIPFLEPYKDYLLYIQAVLIFALGYGVVNSLSEVVYSYFRKIVEHSTAAALRTIARITGIAVLLSILTSVFNLNVSAALTIGSFSGLVVGFATQTILSHVVAGVFLVLSRPFKYGDVITVAGQTGAVKDIRIMHTVLEAPDGLREVLIPSGTIVTAIIIRTLKVEEKT